ncbi:M20/M25/M40 family metallo-hydrolase [Aquabacterium humicola]|uniref:M20/M25/M40 family metallo-hydrolase n=1 Tax=Aquabacterium humicola TaxID=3237377 RepID=UPI002542E2E7|nr:M20/M25/M40 family metallo-hydrolase [Rubrivivax pictus]
MVPRRLYAAGLLLAAALPAFASDLLGPAELAHAQRLREAASRSALAYELVASLTTEVGPRPAGSAGDARAVAWAVERLTTLGFANVRAEPVPMKAWQRGPAHAHITQPFPQPVMMAALGNSVATPPEGLHAEIAYYPDLAALRADAGGERARGRIVFIDEKTERTRDGAGYGKAVAARSIGAIEAARRGALAVAIRSIGTDRDRLPHTGAMRYDPAVPAIPAVAVSVPDAELIARLAAHPMSASRPLKMHLTLQAEGGVPVTTHNVIAEVPGTDLADEVVLIGAHLDSWDLGTGAIDDGAGVGIVVAAAKAILDGGVKPRRTIRVVLFANEENGFDGALAYAERYKNQPHQLVGESDFGAGPVWRLRSRVRPEALPVWQQIGAALAPLGIAAADNNGSPGPDAGVLLRRRGWPAIELTQDGNDYFDWHHTANDTLDKIDPKALPQNTAAWAVAAWLAAQSPVRFGPLPPPPAPPAVLAPAAPASAGIITR